MKNGCQMWHLCFQLPCSCASLHGRLGIVRSADRDGPSSKTVLVVEALHTSQHKPWLQKSLPWRYWVCACARVLLAQSLLLELQSLNHRLSILPFCIPYKAPEVGVSLLSTREGRSLKGLGLEAMRGCVCLLTVFLSSPPS